VKSTLSSSFDCNDSFEDNGKDKDEDYEPITKFPATPAPRFAPKPKLPDTPDDSPTKPTTTMNRNRVAIPVKNNSSLTSRTIRTPRQLFATPSFSNPELQAAQKKHTSLLMELKALKDSMETVTQALALEANPEKDTDLQASIKKWRLAGRCAADTLFGIAGDKVNMLGGPGNGGWRELVGGKKGWQDWEEESKEKGSDDERGDDDGDEGIGGEDQEEQQGGIGKDEEWGMRLMLKSMDIPESMLGWDEDAATWKNIEDMEV
jgi:hypothetical protein